MILNLCHNKVFFAKHVFHLDIIKGTKETDEVKSKGFFPIPAAEHNFCTPFFKHYFGNENDVKAKNAKAKVFGN